MPKWRSSQEAEDKQPVSTAQRGLWWPGERQRPHGWCVKAFSEPCQLLAEASACHTSRRPAWHSPTRRRSSPTAGSSWVLLHLNSLDSGWSLFNPPFQAQTYCAYICGHRCRSRWQRAPDSAQLGWPELRSGCSTRQAPGLYPSSPCRRRKATTVEARSRSLQTPRHRSQSQQMSLRRPAVHDSNSPNDDGTLSFVGPRTGPSRPAGP